MTRILLFALILLLSTPFMGWTANYYVALTGNDANTCVAAQNTVTPKLTFASAVTCLSAGDTLYIRGGTWSQTLDLGAGKVGTAGNYITVTNYPNEVVTIQPAFHKYAIVPNNGQNYVIYDGLILDAINQTDPATPYGFWIAGGTHHQIWQNMELKNNRNGGLYLNTVSDITIRNNKIHDMISVSCAVGTRWYGIYAHNGTNLTVDGNDIYNNPGGGSQIYPGPWTGVIYKNNKLHDNNTCTTSSVGGITVFEETPANGGGDIVGTQIYNNLIYNNGSSWVAPSGTGDYASGIRVSNGVDTTSVWNNTLFGNNGWGLLVQAANSTNTVLRNNISFGNGLGQYSNAGTGTIQDHNLLTDPLFINVSTGDFHLQAGSAAINAGIAISTVITDFAGVTRGTPPEIGAYEFIGSIYYSATNGNNANTCAQAQSTATPKLTILAGIACLSAGDTLRVRAGTYAEQFNNPFPVTGTALNPVTVMNYPGEVVTVKPTGYNAYIIAHSGNSKQYVVYDGLILDGSLITGANCLGAPNQMPGILYISAAVQMTFKNMRITNSPCNGGLIEGDRMTLLNLEVDNNGWSTSYGNSNGLYMEGITNSTITNVNAHDNECFGFRIVNSATSPSANFNIIDRSQSHHNGGKAWGTGGAFDCSSVSGGFVIGDTGNIVKNSLAYANTNIGGYGFWQWKGVATCTGNSFLNNTATNNNYGIHAGTNCNSVTFTNNLSASNVNANFYTTGSGSMTTTTNRMTGLITDCVISTSDLHLKAGTPCINLGSTLASVPIDFDGVARPQGSAYDIGAYELTGFITYYVGPGGNDASVSPTNPATPWANPQRCTTAPIAPGDTCLIADGTYTDTNGDGHTVSTSGGVSGTVSLPITIRSMNPLGAKIIVSSAKTCTAPTTCQDSGFNLVANYYVIDGFDISGGTATGTGVSYAGVQLPFGSGGTGNVISNNYIHHVANICSDSAYGFGGIFVYGNAVNIYGNTIAYIGRLFNGQSGCSTSITQHDHAIYYDNGSSGTIRNNLLHHIIHGFALHIYPGPISGLNIYNNTIADSIVDSGTVANVLFGGSTGGGLSNINFKNNILHGAASSGSITFFSLTASNIVVDHNLCSVPCNSGSNAGVTFTNNLNSIAPGFTNSGVLNYTLAAGSPAIDSGVNVGLPFTGLLPDLGYLEGGDITPPQVPQGFHIK